MGSTKTAILSTRDAVTTMDWLTLESAPKITKSRPTIPKSVSVPAAEDDDAYWKQCSDSSSNNGTQHRRGDDGVMDRFVVAVDPNESKGRTGSSADSLAV